MISIIIPVYNVEKYLNQCLQSLDMQTYTDWECILVDDGSKDKSSEICDNWVEKDSRFRVIHQLNGGVSKARNAGLDTARGDFVTFIDSDDWVDTNYLQILAEGTSVDLVVSGYKMECNDGSSEIHQPTSSSIFSLNETGLEKFVALNRDFLIYAPYAKLFHNAIIKENSIRFPEGCSFGEDLQFNYQYLEHVKTISQIAKANYHYRIIGSGTLSSKKRPDQFRQDYGQWQLLQSFYVRHNLWFQPSKELLYQRLWGIVYDGLFSTNTPIKEILSIPEIKELKNYQHVFTCSRWIKWCILHRFAIAFKK